MALAASGEKPLNLGAGRTKASSPSNSTAHRWAVGSPQCCFTSLASQRFSTQDCQHGTITTRKLAPRLWSLRRVAAVVQTWRCAMHIHICHETDAGENPLCIAALVCLLSICFVTNGSKLSPHRNSSRRSEIIFC